MLKTVSSIANAIGALNYKGTWNASTNSPTLADGTGAKGDYYVVSTAGTQTFNGVQLFFGPGDWIAYNGTVWQRVEGGSDGNFANVTLTSTDAGASASPLLELYRDSASPAASDTLGEIEFNGEDSAGNKQAYGLIHASILSPTTTAEQGQLHFETATAGALTEKMIIGTTNLVINEIGAVFNVRIEGDTDANLFYTDATNSRVGVGTASPSAKFEVSGEAKSSTLTVGASAGAETISTFGNTTVAGSKLIVFNAPDGVRSIFSYRNTAQTWNVQLKGDSTQNWYMISNDSETVGVYMTPAASGWNNLSDERAKENWEELTGAVDKVMTLRAGTHSWKKDASLPRDVGVIAQDVLAILPEAVSTEDPDNLGIRYTHLVPLLIKAIQELKQEIDSLKTTT
jgi:hypothetical protein